MNLAQTKIYLEKIIALYKNMSADERNINAIERDLMLSYIRQLYETCLDTAPSVVAPPQAAKPVHTPPLSPKVTPPPVVEQPKVAPPVAVSAPPPVVETPRYTPPPPPVVESPRYTPPPPPPPVVESPRYTLPQPPPPVESPRYTPPPVPDPPRSRVAQAPASGFSAEIEALFDEQVGKEISDKLSNAPVADLTKAFGLNDRLLMQNELFLNNKSAFDEALKDLNNASSFDTARAFLADLAVRNSWNLNADRQKLAKSFIKLVRRRFK
jgi:hypothetical protein